MAFGSPKPKRITTPAEDPTAAAQAEADAMAASRLRSQKGYSGTNIRGLQLTSILGNYLKQNTGSTA